MPNGKMSVLDVAAKRSLRDAVFATATFIRTVNNALHRQPFSAGRSSTGGYSTVPLPAVYESLPPDIDVVSILNPLIKSGHIQSLRRNRHLTLGRALPPLDACVTVFSGEFPTPHILYHLCQFANSMNDLRYNDEVVHKFHNMAAFLNTRINQKERDVRGALPHTERAWRFDFAELSESLSQQSVAYGCRELPDKHVSAFLDVAEILGTAVRDQLQRDQLRLRGRCDADYMLATTFGLKTDIDGFDSLCGGGLLLPPVSPGAEWLGRTIVIRGDRGTGKTILATKLAIEVASLGGAAFCFALDQTQNDLLRQFACFRWLKPRPDVRVALSPIEFITATRESNGRYGVLGIGGTSKSSLQTHMAAIDEFVKEAQLAPFPLRLIVVDPINSVVPSSDDPMAIRNRRNDFFQRMKRSSVSLIITAEKEPDPLRQFHHEENTADIVINVWAEELGDYPYSQRFIEFSKSRGQPTHRGRHAATIKRGRGLVLYPSTAAVIVERAQRRRPQLKREYVGTGSSELDSLLRFGQRNRDVNRGNGGFLRGDNILIRGSAGAGKTEQALLFLLAEHVRAKRKNERSTRCLYITFGGRADVFNDMMGNSTLIDASLRRYWAHLFFVRTESGGPASADVMRGRPTSRRGKKGRRGPKRNQIPKRTELLENIDVLSFEGGYIRPGEILAAIGSAFTRARNSGQPIGRVVFDDLRYMEDNCPLIANDETFIAALGAILRTETCTTVFVYSDLDEGTDLVGEALGDISDCIIVFKRLFLRGESYTALHVSKTRLNEHDGRVYRHRMDPERGIMISDEFALLTRVMSGAPVPLSVRLFLHNETSHQAEFNERLCKTLEYSLGTSVDLADSDRHGITDSAHAHSTSGVEELQVIQIDEYQVRGRAGKWAHEFPVTDDLGSFAAFTDASVKCCSDGQVYWAVPFYGNLSLLAFDSTKVSDQDVATWGALSKLCDSYDGICFDYPMDADEHLNCLFLEILMDRHLRRLKLGTCTQWLERAGGEISRLFSRKKELTESFKTLWRVGHKAFQSTELRRPSSEGQIRGAVWRHWFGTLHSMLSAMASNQRGNVHVRSLPSNVSVAGDWYLAITRGSTAKRAGEAILHELSSFSAAEERLDAGVGFPLQRRFMDGSRDRFASPFYRLDDNCSLGRLHETAFRRSEFADYPELSATLARLIRQLLRFTDRERLMEAVPSITEAIQKEVGV